MINLRIDITRSEHPKTFLDVVKENIRMDAFDITDFFDYYDVKNKGFALWVKSKFHERMQNELATDTFYKQYEIDECNANEPKTNYTHAEYARLLYITERKREKRGIKTMFNCHPIIYKSEAKREITIKWHSN